MTVYTIDKASDHELVAMVLGLRPDNEAAGRLAVLMASEGYISGASLAEVARECTSVGPRRIERLEASVELGRRALAARSARKGVVVSTPEDVIRVVKPMLVGRTREHFLALALTTRNSLIRIIEVSVGSLNASIVHPRELFKECLAVSAASVIIVHNHPSNGEATASGADVALTRRLVKAGDLLGVELLDSLVLSGDDYVSLRDSNQM